LLTVGCQGLTTVAPVLGVAVITGSDPNGLYIDIPATFTNPSDIAISAGSLPFDLMYNRSNIGRIQIDKFSLRPGRTMVLLHGYVTANRNDQKAVTDLRHMISQYSMNKSVEVTWTGTKNASLEIPFLNEAVSRLVFMASAPGVGKSFVKRASVKWGIFGLFKKTVRSKVFVTNRIILGFSLMCSFWRTVDIPTFTDDHDLSRDEDGIIILEILTIVGHKYAALTKYSTVFRRDSQSPLQTRSFFRRVGRSMGQFDELEGIPYNTSLIKVGSQVDNASHDRKLSRNSGL